MSENIVTPQSIYTLPVYSKKTTRKTYNNKKTKEILR